MKFETKNGGISAVDGIPPGTLEMEHQSYFNENPEDLI